MKKRIVDISLIVYFIALVFVPAIFSKIYDGAPFSFIYLGILFAIHNQPYLSILHIPLIFSILYVVSIIFFAFYTIFRQKNIFVYLVPIVFYFIFSIVILVMWKSSPLFLGFYLSILSLAIWGVYFINQKTNFISKLKNYKRKPTNKERIAQLEKELQAIKDNQNRNA